jgi:hypothetical protein
MNRVQSKETQRDREGQRREKERSCRRRVGSGGIKKGWRGRDERAVKKEQQGLPHDLSLKLGKVTLQSVADAGRLGEGL